MPKMQATIKKLTSYWENIAKNSNSIEIKKQPKTAIKEEPEKKSKLMQLIEKYKVQPKKIMPRKRENSYGSSSSSSSSSDDEPAHPSKNNPVVVRSNDERKRKPI